MMKHCRRQTIRLGRENKWSDSKRNVQPAQATVPDSNPTLSFVWDPARRDSLRKRAERLYVIGEWAAAARLLAGCA